VSFGFIILPLWKGETNGLCEKEMIVVILFIEITFQIDSLSDYTNWGGLVASNLCPKMRIRF